MLLQNLRIIFILSIFLYISIVYWFSLVVYICLFLCLDLPWSLFIIHWVSIYYLQFISYFLTLHLSICHRFSKWKILLIWVVSCRRSSVGIGLLWYIFFLLCSILGGSFSLSLVLLLIAVSLLLFYILFLHFTVVFFLSFIFLFGFDYLRSFMS